MKRALILLKISFITLTFLLLSGVFPSPLPSVGAEEACKTTSCTRAYPWLDYSCPNTACNGCYIANGETGGGHCSNGGGEGEIQ